jgi:hypothetical protein
MRQAFQKYAALYEAILAEAGTDDGRQITQDSDSREATTLEVGR